MDGLILVNKQHPIKKGISEDALCEIGEQGIMMEKEAAGQLLRLLDFIGCDREIVPVSGFRTFEEQKEIFDMSLRENGEAYTLKYVAYPGCSEHQTGLAIDLAEYAEEIDFIAPEFPYYGICQKFRDSAYKFGFVERYPKGKETVTGIAHEPWHFRYVGVPHARVMWEKELTLEEYLGIVV